METLIQQSHRLSQQKYQGEQGKLAPFAGRVVSVNPRTDTVGLSFGPAQERRMPVQHPFSGRTSWIRSMPEKGTMFLMQNRFDTGQPEALKTIPQFSGDRAEEYERGISVYRALQPGEHDIASNGYAFGYFGRRGNLDLRSGSNIKLQLDREDQDVKVSAPTHRQNLLFHTLGAMGDEERLGIVKRWKSAAEEFYVKKGNNFVAEHYRQILNPAKAGPSILLRKIEGHVYDDDGVEIKHTTTALPLRSQRLWYTTTDETLAQEIDQNGNFLTSFPSTATTGMEVLIPDGSFRLEVGKNRDVTILKDEKVQVSRDITYTVGRNVRHTVAKNFQVLAGQNSLSLDTSEGGEAVSLTNPAGFGLLATNAGGGSTSLQGPSGSSLAMASSGATTLTAKQAMTLTVDQDMTLSGSVLNANFTKINLGKGASIPAMLGMTTQMWLDQHVHTGNLGSPTSPPLVPSTSFNGTPTSLVSMTIMLMGNI